MSAQRVIVIGAGVIGCSIAWRLAQRGRSVIVVEKGEPVSQATWAAAGMLHPITDTDLPSFHGLMRASFAEYPAFVAELREITGIDAGLILDEEIGGGSVDNRRLGEAAYIAARAAGVEFRMHTAARRIHHSDNTFDSVELNNRERLEGDAVVIAAGAWSAEILGLPIRIPVVPVRGQMLAVEHEPQLLEHIIITDECYLVPRGEKRLLIGATVEHAGFDTRVTEEGIRGLVKAAHHVVPEVAKAKIVETWAGLRPGTPDELPILGRDPRIEGVYYATGHYRNGILLAPITARLMSELIVSGKTNYDLSDFSIGRFVVDITQPRCDLCGALMDDSHCKIICRSCGYQRDCSDP